MRVSPKVFAFLVAAVVATGAVNAQQATNTSGVIRGKVTDQSTKQPIDGARVSVVGTPFGATTKSDGTFYILATMGTYTVSVYAAGYGITEVPNMTVNESLGDGRGGGKNIEIARKGAERAAPASVSTWDFADVRRAAATTQAVSYPVRTFTLQSLSPGAAASLVAPYMPRDVITGSAGVFESGTSINAITVRAPKEVLATVDSLLRVYDRAPMTITLHFVLIAASDSAIHDPTISETDATLRQMFRFNGYRQIAEGTTTISANAGPGFMVGSSYSMNLKSGGTEYLLSGNVGAASGVGSNLTQQLTVSLYGNSTSANVSAAGPGQSGRGLGPGQRSILSTGLTVPIGQTIVIGGATGNDAGRTLILTVRPELVTKR